MTKWHRAIVLRNIALRGRGRPVGTAWQRLRFRLFGGRPLDAVYMGGGDSVAFHPFADGDGLFDADDDGADGVWRDSGRLEMRRGLANPSYERAGYTYKYYIKHIYCTLQTLNLQRPASCSRSTMFKERCICITPRSGNPTVISSGMMRPIIALASRKVTRASRPVRVTRP